MLLIDGQTGSVAKAINHSAPVMCDPSFLKKQMSNKFTLTITGDNIETYQIDNISIGGDSCIDVSVTRTVTDIDGNVYRMVKIGDQWWMAQNLKVTHYNDGTPIPHVTDNDEWRRLTTGAYCTYNNNENYAITYGRLYNWYAVNDACNIAPEGWHVPTDADWKKLEMILGISQAEVNSDNLHGTNEGSKLAGNAALWNDGELVNKMMHLAKAVFPRFRAVIASIKMAHSPEWVAGAFIGLLKSGILINKRGTGASTVILHF